MVVLKSSPQHTQAAVVGNLYWVQRWWRRLIWGQSCSLPKAMWSTAEVPKSRSVPPPPQGDVSPASSHLPLGCQPKEPILFPPPMTPPPLSSRCTGYLVGGGPCPSLAPSLAPAPPHQPHILRGQLCHPQPLQSPLEGDPFPTPPPLASSSPPTSHSGFSAGGAGDQSEDRPPHFLCAGPAEIPTRKSQRHCEPGPGHRRRPRSDDVQLVRLCHPVLGLVLVEELEQGADVHFVVHVHRLLAGVLDLGDCHRLPHCREGRKVRTMVWGPTRLIGDTGLMLSSNITH